MPSAVAGDRCRSVYLVWAASVIALDSLSTKSPCTRVGTRLPQAAARGRRTRRYPDRHRRPNGCGHNELLIGEFLRARRTLRNTGRLKIASGWCAFNQRADRGTVAFALDQVAFPMAGNEAVLDFGRADVDALHFFDLAAPVDAPAAWFAHLVMVAKASDELTLELAARL
jgi:hypothetical protein